MRSFSPFRGVLFGLALLAAIRGYSVIAQTSSGYWHTQGNEIVDSVGRPVHIHGVNWYGFETRDLVPHGLTQQDYHTILGSIRSMGFNVVRLPFSDEAINSTRIPSRIAFANAGGKINQDLRHLTSIEIMDRIIDAAGALGLRVILDNHRSDAGNGPQANGLWYTERYPEPRWIADWQMLARRYKTKLAKDGNPIVIGVDLRNEPHSVAGKGACWTGDTARGGCPPSNRAENWTAAAIRAGNAVLLENSNLLVFVEGTDCYSGDCTFWGSNLMGVRDNKVVLTEANRVVYSAHDYGPVEYKHRWFSASTTPATLTNVWMRYWGFVAANNIAPVWIGEFGTGSQPADAADATPGSQGQWFSALIGFFASHPPIGWCYWALNGEDRYGLLTRDYTLPDPVAPRQAALDRLLAPSP